MNSKIVIGVPNNTLEKIDEDEQDDFIEELNINDQKEISVDNINENQQIIKKITAVIHM